MLNDELKKKNLKKYLRKKKIKIIREKMTQK